MKREDLLSKISDPSKVWDVVVIGGGATGLGVAVDAVTRGYSVALFEWEDFAKATSSRSTKLVHGGVRYLAQGDVSLVLEALYERGLLQQNAPHLVKNQSFLIPNYRYWDNFLYTVGLTIYDILAGRLSLGRSKYVSKKKTTSYLPTVRVDGLKGGVVYHDGQFDDSRLAVNLAQSCVENGGCPINRMKVTAMLHGSDGRARGVKVQDLMNGQEYEVNTVKDLDYSVYKMRNGDVVTAEAILNRFINKLEIRGAVYRPGIYQLNGKLNTVRELVNEAQGLTGDAFLNRAVLYRQREDLTTEVVPVDIKAIMDGTSQNIILMKNDILYIPSIHDLEDRGNVVIHGEVAKPDSYPYADNMTLEDLIIQAGGLREAASVVRVDVSRRIKNPRSTVDNDTIGQIYTFSLKEGFIVDGTPGFVLQPYDEVYVRRSPGYQAQQNVVVEGEILFGGSYAMTSREERLSDLINKAGGATNYAYLRGAKLTRVANASEKKRMGDVIRLMSRQLGEAMMDSLGVRVENTFSVGIDLEKALANPGSTANIVLREGDVISIPKNNNTVTINGAVMVPNTVSYIKGEDIDYYLNQAGSYSENAKKSKKFIVYMNGQVTKVKGSGKKQIEPGCEIIVPSKVKKRTNMGNILGYATTFSTLGMMVASIANLIKK